MREGGISLKWLPNALTIARCGMAFIVGWAILTLSPIWAFALFLITALSDLVDGYAARKLDAVSKFGAFLDPIADKLLVALGLIAMCIAQGWTLLLVIPTAAIIARDVGVTLLRLAPSLKLPVMPLAKWKTAAEMMGIGALLIAPLTGSIERNSEIFGVTLIWIAALLSLHTGIRYASSAIAQMQNDRA